MSSRFRQARQQRAERAPFTGHGTLNLVPLVDILTSVVFFSMLTYQGDTVASLTAFDLTLPPVVVSAEQAANIPAERQLNLLLTVRVDNQRMLVQHSDRGGMSQQITGLGRESLDTLHALMVRIRQEYPENSEVLVIPDDDVNYDNLINVLERLKMARYTGIALGNRRREAAPGGVASR